MDTLQFEAVKARHGDALLVHAQRGDNKVLLMIDGGAARVYDNFLEPRLSELRGDSTIPLPIDLLVISHIDDDHVNGVLDLTAGLIEAQDESTAPLVKIRELWHNSFDDSIKSTVSGSAVEPGRVIQESAMQVAAFAGNDGELARRLQGSSRLVLESVAQGRRLRNDAQRLGIPLNRRFKDKLILTENAPSDPVHVGEVNIRVIGPGVKELEDLQNRWAKDVQKLLKKSVSREAALEAAARLDTSVFNLSSIVVLVEFSGKSMLLTGDARGDMMLDWLKTSAFSSDEGLHVNLLKIPHHGSDRNITPEFFEKITADHYVVSGDGRHGNPEPATFDMLFSARGQNDEYSVHMTYGPEELQNSHGFDHPALISVLDQHAGSRDRLRFPKAGEKSIVVSL